MLKKYWQGNLPLQISLWFVFFSLLLVINVIEPWFLKKTFTSPDHRITATLISLVITKLIIFPWQLIGLLRASDKDFLLNGNMYKTRGIQLILLLSIVYSFSYSVSLIQSATHHKKKQELADDYASFKEIKNYRLSLRNNKTQLVISGELQIGITKAVSKILRVNPQISNIALNSIGGHIYEGRGLSKLFTRQSLDTYVYKECSSACTTAFSGGAKRYLGTSGKLGFHQYKQDFSIHKKAVGYHDTEAEQGRDLELFKSRGIDTSFLNRIFNESSDSMWFPSHEELRKGKVIDGIINTETH